jgi:hypothetical protein
MASICWDSHRVDDFFQERICNIVRNFAYMYRLRRIVLIEGYGVCLVIPITSFNGIRQVCPFPLFAIMGRD